MPEDEVVTRTRRLKRRKEIVPCHSTPMCFFSHAGQKRLSKIWEEHRLSEELIFSGLSGPTDAFIRERVSDYLQSYLQFRSRRSYIKLKTNDSNESFERREIYAKLDELLRKVSSEKDERRMTNEKERITKLIMDGLMEPIDGFQNISRDPVYIANKLLVTVKQLQDKEPKKATNFALKDLPSIACKENVRNSSRAKTEKKRELSICAKEIEPRIYCSTPKPTLSRAESPSSGFLEITTGSNNLTHEYDEQKFLEESGYEFPTPLMDHEISISSNFSETDINEYAQLESLEDISGDLDFQMYFPWESPLVKDAKQRNSAPEIYDSSTKLLEVYKRQLIFGREFIKEWKYLLSKKNTPLQHFK